MRFRAQLETNVNTEEKNQFGIYGESVLIVFQFELVSGHVELI